MLSVVVLGSLGEGYVHSLDLDSQTLTNPQITPNELAMLKGARPESRGAFSQPSPVAGDFRRTAVESGVPVVASRTNPPSRPFETATGHLCV